MFGGGPCFLHRSPLYTDAFPTVCCVAKESNTHMDVCTLQFDDSLYILIILVRQIDT